MSTAPTAPVLGPAPAPNGSPRTRLYYGDFIRVAGMIAVVAGHICDMVLFKYADVKAGQLRAADWWLVNIIDAASRWAVPAYVMLSGALLLGSTRPEPLGSFYSRRFLRVGVPTVVWTVVFLFFDVYYTRWHTWPAALANLAAGAPYPHMHFMFLIAGLYLFTPMLRLFVQQADRRMLTLAIVLCFAVAGAHSVLSVLTAMHPTAFSRFVPFIGFYLAGYALRDTRLSRRELALCWLNLLAGIAVLAIVTGLLLSRLGQGFPAAAGAGLLAPKIHAAYPVAHIMLEFLNPVRIIIGLCAWLIIVNTFTQPWPDRQPWRFITNILAPATLGIYLVHPLFREFLWCHDGGVLWRALWPHAWVGIPLVFVVVYGLSLGLTWVMLRIPGVRHAAG